MIGVLGTGMDPPPRQGVLPRDNSKELWITQKALRGVIVPMAHMVRIFCTSSRKMFTSATERWFDETEKEGVNSIGLTESGDRLPRVGAGA